MARPTGRCWRNVLSLRSSRTSYPRRFSSSWIPESKKPAQRAGFSNLVGDRGLLATTWLALRAVTDATFSRYARVEPLAPGGSHPRGSRKAKSPLKERAFLIWSVIEDYSPLRGSPYGPLLAQRSLATLESNLLPPKVLILVDSGKQKARSKSGLF